MKRTIIFEDGKYILKTILETLSGDKQLEDEEIGEDYFNAMRVNGQPVQINVEFRHFTMVTGFMVVQNAGWASAFAGSAFGTRF